MADEEQVAILNQGAKVWNKWREQAQPELINLYKADLRQANLNHANLSGVILRQANLRGAYLAGANLHKAILSHTNLYKADLSGADLTQANLRGSDLSEAKMLNANLCQALMQQANLIRTNLSEADLTQANLTEAKLDKAILRRTTIRAVNLTDAILHETCLCEAHIVLSDFTRAILVRTQLKNAKFNNCRVYGISAWDADLTGAEQFNLIITPKGQPTITVDNLQVAQFMYLLLNNPEVRDVIDTITSKVVLILGRFTPERKKTLDAIHVAVRHAGYVPIMFDFDKPASLDFMETVSILASMTRFVIADLTDEKVVLAELYQMVREHPSKPVQPILLKGKPLNVLVQDFRNRGRESFLPIYEYSDDGELLETLADKVIAPAERLLKKQQSQN